MRTKKHILVFLGILVLTLCIVIPVILVHADSVDPDSERVSGNDLSGRSTTATEFSADFSADLREALASNPDLVLEEVPASDANLVLKEVPASDANLTIDPDYVPREPGYDPNWEETYLGPLGSGLFYAYGFADRYNNFTYRAPGFSEEESYDIANGYVKYAEHRNAGVTYEVMTFQEFLQAYIDSGEASIPDFLVKSNYWGE